MNGLIRTLRIESVRNTNKVGRIVELKWRKKRFITYLDVVPMTIPPAQPQTARGVPTLLYVATTNLAKQAFNLSSTIPLSSAKISGSGGSGRF